MGIRIKTGDTVKIISGKLKGTIGKVNKIQPFSRICFGGLPRPSADAGEGQVRPQIHCGPVCRR